MFECTLVGNALAQLLQTIYEVKELAELELLAATAQLVMHNSAPTTDSPTTSEQKIVLETPAELLTLDKHRYLHLFGVTEFRLVFPASSSSNSSSSYTVQTTELLLGTEESLSSELTVRDKFMDAAIFNEFDSVRLLIEEKIITDLDLATNSGWTALHFAAREGHFGIVSYLCKQGANVEAVTENKWSALHLACFHGHDDIVDLLVVFDADTQCTTNSAESCIDLATRGGINTKLVLQCLEL
jgi:hypothetical protein